MLLKALRIRLALKVKRIVIRIVKINRIITRVITRIILSPVKKQDSLCRSSILTQTRVESPDISAEKPEVFKTLISIGNRGYPRTPVKLCFLLSYCNSNENILFHRKTNKESSEAKPYASSPKRDKLFTSFWFYYLKQWHHLNQ